MASVNAENPRFLSPGMQVKVKARVIGDTVNHNSRWVLTEQDEFLSEEGFPQSSELSNIPITIKNSNNSPLFNALKIPELWKISMGEGVKIGIIDNGVYHHDSLRGIVTQMNDHPEITPSNHGTTMSCIIGSFDEENGKIGVAPRVSNIYSYFIDVKEELCGINARQLLIALEEMDALGINIINMSFTCRQSNFRANKKEGRELQEKITALVKKNCLLVAACGNANLRTRDSFPASYENVISITGHDESGEILNEGSNFWVGTNIALPVSNYFSDFQLGNAQGTSSASAIFSGFLACIYHNTIGEKHEKIISAINKLESIQDSESVINVFKFNTDKFLHNLNLRL